MDVFALELRLGSNTIRDFVDHIDKFGLTNGLTFDNLTIGINSTNTATVIKNSSSNETLASVMGVNPINLTSADFVRI
jgi:hypothetical protein